MTPQNNPTEKPPPTSFKVCCRRMMRAEPSIPASRIKKQSQPTGLNWNNETVGKQSADHHAAACHVCADFPVRKLIRLQMTMQIMVARMIPHM